MIAAVADYRNALVYSPHNSNFQFHLARALAAAGQTEEVRSCLLNHLPELPGSGEINLELAEIAARNGEMTDALHYYHSAVYGVWESDPLAMRWLVRRDLCEFLLDRGATAEAQPEVIALAQDAPAGDVARQKDADAFLLRVNLWSRALDEFRSVLEADGHDEDALVDAGTAAFQMGQYSHAIEYFDRLQRRVQMAPNAAEMLDTSRQVESADPFRSGLSAAERARRAASALALAGSHIEECAREHGEAIEASPANDGNSETPRFAASNGPRVERDVS